MNKIWVKVAVGLLLIGLFGLPAYCSTLDEELQKLKEAGIPTTIEELNLPKIPDAENGALVYKEVFKLRDSLNGKYKELLDYSPYQGKLMKWEAVPEAKKAKVADFILNNSEFTEMYQLLEKASKMKCLFIKKEDSQTITTNPPLSHLNNLRSCANDLADKAKIEAEYGDINKALNASLIGLRIPKCLSNEPLIIDQLVRIAMDGIALSELEKTMNKGEGGLELYQSLINEMEKERNTNIINIALKRELVCATLPLLSQSKKLGEKAFDLTEEEKNIEKLYGAASVKQIKNEKQTLRNVYLNSGCKTPEEFFEKQEISFLRRISEVILLTEKPYSQANKELEKIDKDIENLSYEEIMIKMIMSTSNYKLYTSEARCDAQLGTAEIAIANKIYKQKHGEYVGLLSQLTPEILSSLPLDPFTGKDYIYKKKDKGFIVYSLGDNMKDDNGTKKIYKKDSPAYENYDIVWECK